MQSGGKIEEIAVGENTETDEIVMSERLDGNDIGASFLKFQGHGAAADTVVEHTPTNEAAPT
jgi:hypothetical protein